MGSRMTSHEFCLLMTLVIVVSLFGALVGAFVYFMYIPVHDFSRREMLLSAILGALVATLPITFFYTRQDEDSER